MKYKYLLRRIHSFSFLSPVKKTSIDQSKVLKAVIYHNYFFQFLHTGFFFIEKMVHDKVFLFKKKNPDTNNVLTYQTQDGGSLVGRVTAADLHSVDRFLI